MVRIACIRLLLGLVVHLDLELFQTDVETTFLKESLEEEIDIDKPISFASQGQEGKVCHLKQSIYGLKQSSRSWYFRFHEVIIYFRLNMVLKDTGLYVKKTVEEIMSLTLYINDILLAENNMEIIKITKWRSSSVFKMKDMSEARYAIGIEINRNRSKKLLGFKSSSIHS